MISGTAADGGDGAASGATLEGVVILRPAARPGPIGLREAVTSGALPVPEGSTPGRWLAAVRKARQYDAEFPAPADEDGPRGERRYDPDALAAWARNRPRAGVG
jgi:hypothetical protein